MEQLLKLHAEHTKERLDNLHDDLREVKDKLDALQNFKIETIVSARWVSFMVSTVCGFVTMIGTAVLTYFIERGSK
jgi:hypothetical protein